MSCLLLWIGSTNAFLEATVLDREVVVAKGTQEVNEYLDIDDEGDNNYFLDKLLKMVLFLNLSENIYIFRLNTRLIRKRRFADWYVSNT